MTDRELLELAAKAFGFGKKNRPEKPHCWTESEYPKGSGKHGALWNYVGYGDTAELWNPLSDDGDALRLAVYLFRDIHFWYFDNSVSVGNELRVVCGDDPCATTRLAIVRAAAEVGRGMP